jgi:HSF-type DNA-binding
MTFNYSIIGLSASYKEHQETEQARDTNLSLLGSCSYPHVWKRDHLELDKTHLHPSLCNKLKCYHDSLSLVDASHCLKIQSNLSNLRAHLIKSSAIQDTLLLLDVQKKTRDIQISNMLLRHQTAFYQSLMENPSTMILGANRSMYGHVDEYLLSMKGKRSSFHTFPHRLHEIMSNPEYSEYITWLPNGYAWKILQRKQFESVVIPRHFRHGRFTSFMRQVRMKNKRSTNQCRYRF